MSAWLLWGVWLGATLGWWALAFYPVTPQTADWVLRTQFVCFGSMPNGLPTAEGWIMLILAPLTLLAAMIVLFREETRACMRAIRDHRTTRLVFFLVALITLAEAAWVTQRIRFALPNAFAGEVFTQGSLVEGPLPAHYPRVNTALPDFHLDDQRGAVMTKADLKGKITVLTFVFAHCASVCPGLAYKAKEVMEMNLNPKLQATLVTLDPWRDTPGSLPGLAERWGLLDERIRLLSGSPPELSIFFERLGITSSRDEKNGDITHAPLVAIVDREGRIAYWFNNAPTRWIQDATERLLRETAGS